MNDINRNYAKSKEFSKQIHDLIPGGAHTYSKGDDQFPQLSPAAIAYGKGSHVWDIDGNEYLDCAMGLSSVSLGHAYGSVLERVKIELEKGVNFQRPSVIELEMAKRFLSLVPQHDMVKFAHLGNTDRTLNISHAVIEPHHIIFGHDITLLTVVPLHVTDGGAMIPQRTHFSRQ